MTEEIKAKLKAAMDYCDAEDKSTEFMIQYMMDAAEVDHETVIDYLTTEGGFTEVKS